MTREFHPKIASPDASDLYTTHQADPPELDDGGVEMTGKLIANRDLSGRIFDEYDFHGATFFNCQLGGTDFRLSTGLLPGSFPQSNLAGARMPEELSFKETLASITEAAKRAQQLFLLLIGACFYCLLTVATTTDRSFLESSATAVLPIIDAKVPVASFFLFAPILILFVFIWLHGYMQRVWGMISVLPEVFPDGLTCAVRMYQWLPLSFGATSAAKREAKRSLDRFSGMELILSFAGLWGFVPATLLVLFFGYLPRHDFWGSMVICAAFSAVVAYSVLFARRATQAFKNKGGQTKQRWHDATVLAGPAAIAAALLSPFIDATENSYAETGDPSVSARIWTGFVDLTGVSLDLDPPNNELFIQKPATWSTDLEGKALTEVLSEIEQLEWEGRNFDRAEFGNLFLPRVSFEGAEMNFLAAPASTFVNANFSDAQLAHSEFKGADLRDANFFSANLQNADFRYANLRGACFHSANLEGAVFENADVSGAYIANLDNEYFLTDVDDYAEQFNDTYCSDETIVPTETDLKCKRKKSGKPAGSQIQLDWCYN